MATQTITTLIDDLDGSEAVETTSFTLDDVEYSIDLNTDHAIELRASLSRYIDAGRKTGGTKRQSRAARTVDTKAIRQWALDNGFQVNTRGRIQADIIEKYEAAH